uniref:Uncharacterized protein n=1 Tax=Anguilla anguilla TaxID=7936 RepID=A0A0E9VRB1_ANGAN
MHWAAPLLQIRTVVPSKWTAPVCCTHGIVGTKRELSSQGLLGYVIMKRQQH